jgi:hypothetical protein
LFFGFGKGPPQLLLFILIDGLFYSVPYAHILTTT